MNLLCLFIYGIFSGFLFAQLKKAVIKNDNNMFLVYQMIIIILSLICGSVFMPHIN